MNYRQLLENRGATNIQEVSTSEYKIKFQLDLTSKEQWEKWLDRFSVDTSVSWNVRNTFREAVHAKFKKNYVCQHNQYRGLGIRKEHVGLVFIN